MKNLLFVFAALVLVTGFARADDDSYAAGGFFPPLQYPSGDESVIGLRVSPGWANHKEMYGVDFGTIGNRTSSKFVGMAFAGVFNATAGDATILFTQMAGVVNHNTGKTRVIGLQLSTVYNYTAGSNNVYGMQLSSVGNFGSGNNIYGFQFGIYNQAEHIYGFQIGVINRTKNLHGIQIGLINFSEKGGFPVFPVINIGF